jgi:16S rRNA (uracil1498-N3)-methyltransferase
MQRFLILPTARVPELVVLTGDEAHHAARVVRVQSGEPVVLLDGAGLELAGTVAAVGKREVQIQVTAERRHPAPATEIVLLQAIAKGAAMEGLIHRAVELGCRRLVPLLSERSVSRPDDAEAKRSKWQAIADEALKQSGNPWRLTVESPVTPAAWIARAEPLELLLIGSLLDTPQHPRVHFERFHTEHDRFPKSLGLVVGPEGDFSALEYAAFQQAGARSLTLGPLILRVETAATALLAVVQHELSSRAA